MHGDVAERDAQAVFKDQHARGLQQVTALAFLPAATSFEEAAAPGEGVVWFIPHVRVMFY